MLRIALVALHLIAAVMPHEEPTLTDGQGAALVTASKELAQLRAISGWEECARQNSECRLHAECPIVRSTDGAMDVIGVLVSRLSVTFATRDVERVYMAMPRFSGQLDQVIVVPPHGSLEKDATTLSQDLVADFVSRAHQALECVWQSIGKKGLKA